MRRAVLSCLMLAAPIAGAQITYTTIARTGDVVPNTGGATAFRFAPAVINDGGYVASDVLYDRQAPKHALTLFPAPRQYDPKAIQGNAAPGVDDGATFSAFYYGSPTLNRIGQLQFRTRLDNAAIGNAEAIFTTPSPLSEIAISMFLTAREGEQVPGQPPGVVYDRGMGNSAFLPNLLSDGGQVAFPSALAGPGITADNGYAFFAGAPGSPSLVLRQGDPAPHSGFTVALSNFNGVRPNINAAGQITLRTALRSGSVYFQDAAVLRLTPPAGGQGAYKLEQLASLREYAPGFDNQMFGGHFSAPSLNPAGYTAFTADISTPAATWPQVVYVGKPGSLAIVARTQDAAPGTAGLKFNRFSPPLLAADNSVAFTASLLTSDGSHDTGLWIGQPGKVRLVAHEGDPAPAGPGTFFGDLSVAIPRFAVNSYGQVVFQAPIASMSGSALSAQGLFGTDRAGHVLLIAQSGQAFNPGTGAKTADTWTAVFGSNSDDGLPAALNDRGEVVFTLSFGPGTPDEAAAIVRATIPLPGDATGDGIVDTADFKRLYANLNEPGDQPAGDFDYNGVVNFADFQVLERWYGTRLSDPLPVAAPLPAELRALADSVPEPGVAGVLAAAVLVGRRWRRS